MNYKIFIAAAMVTVLVLPGLAMAGGSAAGESNPALSVEKSVEGKLVIMERYGHILIRPETGNLTRLRMRPDTVVTRNGKTAKFSDLRGGDKVRAYYDSDKWVSEIDATGS